jgi:hypothetical protein
LASFAIDSAGGPVSIGGEEASAAWFTRALSAPAGYKAALATSFSRPDIRDMTPSSAGFCPLFGNATVITTPNRAWSRRQVIGRLERLPGGQTCSWNLGIAAGKVAV